MNAIPLDIAVEDELSELVAVRLVGHARGRYHVGNIHRRGGYGYLKSKIRGWNSAAKALCINKCFRRVNP